MAKRRALLIGVSEYVSPQINALPIVRQDLTILEEALQRSLYQVTVIGRNGPMETTRSQIRSQLSNACKQAKGIETLLLYLSGHGFHYQGKDYFAPADAVIDDPEELEDYLISLDLGNALDQCPAQTIVLVVDACREGVQLTGQAKSIGLSGWSSGAIRQAAKRNLAVVFGCSQGQLCHFVSGEQGFSLFTRAFADVMDPVHPACSFADVVIAVQERLIELSEQCQKPLQEIRIIQESGANKEEQRRIICEGKQKIVDLSQDAVSFQAVPLIPLQMPAIPTKFVPRPEHSDELKRRLLGEDVSGTLVVSAIHGLGGIGKSVLAAVLTHEDEVQKRFSDGILWVTLGQQPDIQKNLGDWIQSLRDFDYKPTTVGAASSHLRTLLFDKRMLLVIDDVWQSDHLEPFRVGGKGCRVLVTTREAVIKDAERYDLDVMTEEQSLKLLEVGMNRSIAIHERAEAIAFVKAVGYLPLALELTSVQVNEGFTWPELLAEFQKEVIQLEFLDSSETTQDLTEEQLRSYSLRACFNLSLRRLSLQLLKQFSWLGVLPEDVEITHKMTAVLWEISPLQAKKVLQNLKDRAFLTIGLMAQGGEQTYRLHDLMHDTARWLIVQSPNANLTGLGLSLPEAQKIFLERYRKQIKNSQWHTLRDDGYIHTYLTWHMEKANCLEEICSLLTEETDDGHNGWYLACNRLGKTASYLDDVNRAWNLIDANKSKILLSKYIRLQCLYSLLFSSLNSLASNITSDFLVFFVKNGVFNQEQSLAYACQIPSIELRANTLIDLIPNLDKVYKEKAISYAFFTTKNIKYRPKNKAKIFIKLSVYLDESLLEAFEAAIRIKDASSRPEVLGDLVPRLSKTMLLKAFNLSFNIKDKWIRRDTICELVPRLPASYLLEAFQSALQIENSEVRAEILSKLTPQLPEALPEAFQSALQIEDSEVRAAILGELVPRLPASYLLEAFQSALQIENSEVRAEILSKLTPQLPEALPEAFQSALQIEDSEVRAAILSKLASRLPTSYLPEAFQSALQIKNSYHRAAILSELAPRLPASYLPEAFQSALQIEDSEVRAEILSKLAPRLPEALPEAFQSALQIEDSEVRAAILSKLTPQLPEALPEAFQSALQIKNSYHRAAILGELVPRLPAAYLPEAFQSALQIKNSYHRAEILSELAPRLPASYLPEVFQSALRIKNFEVRAKLLSELASRLPEALPEAFQSALQIEDSEVRAKLLSELAPRLPEALPEAFQLALQIEDSYHRAKLLSELAPRLPASYLPEAFQLALQIEDFYHRAKLLSELVPRLPASYLPEAFQSALQIEDLEVRVAILSELASRLPASYLPEAFQSALQIEDLEVRVAILGELAPRLPEALPEAFQSALQIEDLEVRVAILGELAPRLPEALPEAFQSALQIENSEVRVRLLSELAPRLPASYLPEAIQSALQTENSEVLVQLFRTLKFQWSNFEPTLLKYFLSTIQTIFLKIGDAREQEHVLNCLSLNIHKNFPSNSISKDIIDNKCKNLTEDLKKAIEIEYDAARADALSDLAPYLSGELLSEALKSSLAIHYEPSRIQALQALIPQIVKLPSDQLLTVWQLCMRELSKYKRSTHLQNLAVLTPIIITLGKESINEITYAIKAVNKWWP